MANLGTALGKKEPESSQVNWKIDAIGSSADMKRITKWRASRGKAAKR
jgi:hypothetical protein